MKTGDMATAFMAGLLLTVAIINICSSNKQKKDKLPVDKRQELKQLLAQHVENEQRHYPYFYLSSGFAFGVTTYHVPSATAASASRLCFRTEKLAQYAGKIFLQYYRKAITGK